MLGSTGHRKLGAVGRLFNSNPPTPVRAHPILIQINHTPLQPRPLQSHSVQSASLPKMQMQNKSERRPTTHLWTHFICVRFLSSAWLQEAVFQAGTSSERVASRTSRRPQRVSITLFFFSILFLFLFFVFGHIQIKIFFPLFFQASQLHSFSCVPVSPHMPAVWSMPRLLTGNAEPLGPS